MYAYATAEYLGLKKLLVKLVQPALIESITIDTVLTRLQQLQSPNLKKSTVANFVHPHVVKVVARELDTVQAFPDLSPLPFAVAHEALTEYCKLGSAAVAWSFVVALVEKRPSAPKLTLAELEQLLAALGGELDTAHELRLLCWLVRP